MTIGKCELPLPISNRVVKALVADDSVALGHAKVGIAGLSLSL